MGKTDKYYFSINTNTVLQCFRVVHHEIFREFILQYTQQPRMYPKTI